jgi:hypothetical protein
LTSRLLQPLWIFLCKRSTSDFLPSEEADYKYMSQGASSRILLQPDSQPILAHQCLLLPFHTTGTVHWFTGINHWRCISCFMQLWHNNMGGHGQSNNWPRTRVFMFTFRECDKLIQVFSWFQCLCQSLCDLLKSADTQSE